MSETLKIAIARLPIQVGFKGQMLDGSGREVKFSNTELSLMAEVDLMDAPIGIELGDDESEAAAVEAIVEMAAVVTRASARAFVNQVRHAAQERVYKPAIAPSSL